MVNIVDHLAARELSGVSRDQNTTENILVLNSSVALKWLKENEC